MTCPTILGAGRFGVQVETNDGLVVWVHVDQVRNARRNIQASWNTTGTTQLTTGVVVDESDCIELLGAIARAAA